MCCGGRLIDECCSSSLSVDESLESLMLYLEATTIPLLGGLGLWFDVSDPCFGLMTLASVSLFGVSWRFLVELRMVKSSSKLARNSGDLSWLAINDSI